MTVGELRQRMDQGEYVRWAAYYARQAQKEELASKAAKRKR